MANPWFRLYSRMMTDPKIEMLSFDDQRHFVWLLCMKNEGYLDECMPSQEAFSRMVGRKLGLQGEALDNTKKRLMEVGLITDAWQPVSWESLQVISDQDVTRAERQKRYRDKKRNALRNALDDAKVTVLDTEQIQNRTEQKIIFVDTTRTTEPEQHASTSEAVQRVRKKSRIDPNLSLTQAWADEAKRINPSCNAHEVFEQFKDHWLGNAETKADWTATWRNWLRNDRKFSKPRQPVESSAPRHRRI